MGMRGTQILHDVARKGEPKLRDAIKDDLEKELYVKCGHKETTALFEVPEIIFRVYLGDMNLT